MLLSSGLGLETSFETSLLGGLGLAEMALLTSSPGPTFPAQHRRAFSVAGPMPWKAGILSRILSGIQQTVQTALGVYSRRACLRNTTASSTLGVPIMRDI